jgi:hypothetical protein
MADSSTVAGERHLIRETAHGPHQKRTDHHAEQGGHHEGFGPGSEQAGTRLRTDGNDGPYRRLRDGIETIALNVFAPGYRGIDHACQQGLLDLGERQPVGAAQHHQTCVGDGGNFEVARMNECNVSALTDRHRRPAVYQRVGQPEPEALTFAVVPVRCRQRCRQRRLAHAAAANAAVLGVGDAANERRVVRDLLQTFDVRRGAGRLWNVRQSFEFGLRLVQNLFGPAQCLLGKDVEVQGFDPERVGPGEIERSRDRKQPGKQGCHRQQHGECATSHRNDLQSAATSVALL